MRYRLYIDEVGNPDFGSCHDHNHRFLSLTGVILDIDHVQNTVHPQMEKLKRDFFDHHPDEPLIFHRKDLMNAKPPFQVLQNPQIKQSFDCLFLSLLKEWDYTIITVCIDKLSHSERYSEWKFEPYHYCLEVLLERYFYYLDAKKTVGDAMAESRGGKEDMKLKEVYTRLWKLGTHFVSASRFAQEIIKILQGKYYVHKGNVHGKKFL